MPPYTLASGDKNLNSCRKKNCKLMELHVCTLTLATRPTYRPTARTSNNTCRRVTLETSLHRKLTALLQTASAARNNLFVFYSRSAIYSHLVYFYQYYSAEYEYTIWPTPPPPKLQLELFGPNRIQVEYWYSSSSRRGGADIW